MCNILQTDLMSMYRNYRNYIHWVGPGFKGMDDVKCLAKAEEH